MFNNKIIGFEGVSVTVLIAGAGTGKTTILKGLETASTYVRGFEFADMSSVMDWHRDPSNCSPHLEYFQKAKQDQSKGVLINDVHTTEALSYYLGHVNNKLRSIDGLGLRHIVLSGFPRTGPQKDIFLDLFKNSTVAYIDCSREIADKNRVARIESGEQRPDDRPEVFNYRWDTFESKTFPDVVLPLKEKLGDRFVTIPFTDTPLQKVKRLLRAMQLTSQERCSLLNQITNENCEACQYLLAVGKKQLTRVISKEQNSGNKVAQGFVQTLNKISSPLQPAVCR